MQRRSFLAGAAGLLLDGLSSSRSRAAATSDDNLFRDFGRGFQWGVSTSAYQIEGAVDVDGRGDSIWDVYARVKGNIRDGDTATIATDYYNRYPDDIKLIADGGFGNYRFSTSWPRIMPAGAGAVNPRGLDFYDRVVDECLARGVVPWVCLYHWDLPQALHERGGWLNRDSAQWFTDYAVVVARRLGDRVKHWAMLNEAAVHAMIGYGFGGHAPGLSGKANYFAAMHHLNLAQGRALSALRAEGSNAKLGTVMCLEPVRAVTESEGDRRAAAYFDAYWKGASIDPLFKGRYPQILEDGFAAVVRDGDMVEIQKPVDYLGLNYYNELHIKVDDSSPFGLTFGPPPEGSILTAMRWPIEPEGLYRQLMDLRDHYGNPPVYVAENGAAFDDRVNAEGKVPDPERIGYFRVHFQAALRALRDGADLRGYFVWSLLDNFEWTEGMSKRFGIVHVDFKTLKRTPKDSFAWLASGLRRWS